MLGVSDGCIDGKGDGGNDSSLVGFVLAVTDGSSDGKFDGPNDGAPLECLTMLALSNEAIDGD